MARGWVPLLVALVGCESTVDVLPDDGGGGSPERATTSNSGAGPSGSNGTDAGPGSGSGSGAGSMSSGTGGAGSMSSGSVSTSVSASSSGAGGSEPIPADGAETGCQLLASVGAWYDEPQGEACTACIREMTGQDGISFTSCTSVGLDCETNGGCHAIWICLSDAEYAVSSIEPCIDAASASSQELFLEVLECILPWCGGPDACAFSGNTPGCDLD